MKEKERCSTLLMRDKNTQHPQWREKQREREEEEEDSASEPLRLALRVPPPPPPPLPLLSSVSKNTLSTLFYFSPCLLLFDPFHSPYLFLSLSHPFRFFCQNGTYATSHRSLLLIWCGEQS
ncbi:hypothetical protein RJT34_24795 [Clitoria ternatea]|uniref:Uncharacterized protein n=1 Tax=Clitoria ternatea TaxID=43366 RepID=A0AAN9FWZ1_CLITE